VQIRRVMEMFRLERREEAMALSSEMLAEFQDSPVPIIQEGLEHLRKLLSSEAGAEPPDAAGAAP
jgi:hypothetical protein